MQTETPLKRVQISGMLGKLSEELHLHRAEQRFGSPECGAGLEDAIGNNVHAAMMQ